MKKKRVVNFNLQKWFTKASAWIAEDAFFESTTLGTCLTRSHFRGQKVCGYFVQFPNAHFIFTT